MARASIPAEVIWSYTVAAIVVVAALLTMAVRGDWRKAHGADTLMLFGPMCYAVPLAAFGVEHFTLTGAIASIVPPWIPWHQFWAYFVGACFVAAAVSLVTGIQARLSAALLALTFFLFVLLMDAPAWARNPRDRFGLALALRELSFSAGALALAASLGAIRHGAAAIARYAIAIALLVYSVQQLMHGAYVPGIPLNRLTPAYVYGHAVWTYLTGAAYAAGGMLLLAGRNARAAATWLGAAVLVVVLVVYVPIAVAERTRITGLNFLMDTLMYCGALLLLARAMRPNERRVVRSAAC